MIDLGAQRNKKELRYVLNLQGIKSIAVREQELGTNTKKVLKVFLQEEISVF